ncbi:MAG: ARMT1-like domain-containing protein [Candidatus Edwardsbacteria bacterium]
MPKLSDFKSKTLGLKLSTPVTCIPCILEDLIEACDELIKNRKKGAVIVKEALAFLSQEVAKESHLPSYFVTGVHRILKKKLGIEIPFARRRKKCNEIGLKIAKRVKIKAKSLKGYQRFYFLVKWAIAGNHLDFRTAGAGYTFNLNAIEEMLEKEVKRGLAVDETKRLWQKIKKAQKILYVLDNVGEIALDRLVMQAIKETGDKRLVAVVRGGAITSDAIMRDAVQVQIPEVADSVIISGPDTLGISFEEMSTDLQNELSAAELVIAKGQANFYAFFQYAKTLPGRTFCLFSTKCDLVSSLFNKAGKINVIVKI